MKKYINEVIDALQNIPDFEGVDPSNISRLGGLTNLVHKVEMDTQSVIVRIPGPGTEEYIDRVVEANNAKVAAKVGVSPKVIYADTNSGIMVTETVKNIKTMSPDLFKMRKEAPKRAGQALAKLHNSGETFEFRFELFSMIDEYLEILSTKDVNFPNGYHEVVKAARPIKDLLEKANLPLAPCHCDPLCENFLDDGNIMWIVDWEYSGMNDPLWDLGDLSVEAGMSDLQDLELLQAYFGRHPNDQETARMIIYKAMCDLLWTLWGLIQHADKNPAEDFWTYASTRFARCKELMQHPSFQDNLKAIERVINSN
jgi:thiamine kinase-like enzyme